MPWLKLLHIGAVIVWCGALMYLPALLHASGRVGHARTRAVPRQLPRTVFIGVATPAALMAIAAGTWIFVDSGLLAPWLIFKLGVVALLVLAHGACGLLVLRVEDAHSRTAAAWCRALQAALPVLLLTIAWLVLRKPS